MEVGCRCDLREVTQMCHGQREVRSWWAVKNWPGLPRRAVEMGCGKFTGGEAEGSQPSITLVFRISGKTMPQALLVKSPE